MNINDGQRAVITALGKISADLWQIGDDGSFIWFHEDNPETTHESLTYWKRYISRLVVFVANGRVYDWGLECAFPKGHFYGSWSPTMVTDLGADLLVLLTMLSMEYDIRFEVRDIGREQETA